MSVKDSTSVNRTNNPSQNFAFQGLNSTKSSDYVLQKLTEFDKNLKERDNLMNQEKQITKQREQRYTIFQNNFVKIMERLSKGDPSAKEDMITLDRQEEEAHLKDEEQMNAITVKLIALANDQ